MWNNQERDGGFEKADLSRLLDELRAFVELGFSPETAQSGSYTCDAPSAGQCAAVALIVQEALGGQLVSAHVGGISHWFNRVRSGNGELDVDITADQFGLPPIRSADAGMLYPETRVRQSTDVREETKRRSALLRQLANERRR